MEFHGGRPPNSRHYEEFTARQRRHHAERGCCLYTLLDPADGAVIGFTGAQPWPQDWGPAGEIEIGWRLGRAHWGKGYATAAAQTALEPCGRPESAMWSPWWTRATSGRSR